MSSGDTLLVLTPHHRCGPATAFAQNALVAGASTPAEQVHVLAFDKTTQEYADFYVALPRNYVGGGLTCALIWSCDGSGIAGETVVFGIAIRRVQDDAEDLDTTVHTYDYNKVTGSQPSAVGEVAYDVITFTNGADMDSWAVGEYAIIRVSRVVGDAGDNYNGDIYLHSIEIRET